MGTRLVLQCFVPTCTRNDLHLLALKDSKRHREIGYLGRQLSEGLEGTEGRVSDTGSDCTLAHCRGSGTDQI